MNDIKKIKSLLKNKHIDPSYDQNHSLVLAIECNNFNIVKLLIKDKRIDLSRNNISQLIISAKQGSFYMLKFLLKQTKINPSTDKNEAIITAYKCKYYDVVGLLWTYDSVKQTLINDNYFLYNTLKNIETKYKVELF
jgi:hypothetical protein